MAKNNKLMAQRKKYEWVLEKPKVKPATTDQKIIIEEKCQLLIDDFKKRFTQEPNTDYGYITDIYGKWYRHYFYFCQLMKYDNPNFIAKEVEHKFARLERITDNTYNLSYFRHTGQWWQVFEEQSLESCLESIKTNPIFYP
jgi:hypothetical protein